MSYYKVAYEADTVEGLKAILDGVYSEGSFDDSKAMNSKNSAPPPPLLQDRESDNAVSDIAQAPPSGGQSDGSITFSDHNEMQSPPPSGNDGLRMDIDMVSEGDFQPPPDMMQNQRNAVSELDQEIKPPEAQSDNSSKESKKGPK